MYRVLSLLLQYPEADVLEQLAAVRAELAAGPSAAAADVARFIDWIEAQPPAGVRAQFAETFDFHAETSLHLTYHLWGDLRERGQVLAALKSYYREAGLVLEGGELPDYLPLMLEFAAEVPGHGESLLQAFRAPIEALRRRLTEQQSPYGLLLAALSGILPLPAPELEEEVQKILAGGPPQEMSGIDPAAGYAGLGCPLVAEGSVGQG
ncbi:MAG: nitrate reductase molybdenum cofactor assembly chaperone [Symbiobacteriia bacterium]